MRKLLVYLFALFVLAPPLRAEWVTLYNKDWNTQTNTVNPAPESFRTNFISNSTSTSSRPTALNYGVTPNFAHTQSGMSYFSGAQVITDGGAHVQMSVTKPMSASKSSSAWYDFSDVNRRCIYIEPKTTPSIRFRTMFANIRQIRITFGTGITSVGGTFKQDMTAWTSEDAVIDVENGTITPKASGADEVEITLPGTYSYAIHKVEFDIEETEHVAPSDDFRIRNLTYVEDGDYYKIYGYASNSYYTDIAPPKNAFQVFYTLKTTNRTVPDYVSPQNTTTISLTNASNKKTSTWMWLNDVCGENPFMGVALSSTPGSTKSIFVVAWNEVGQTVEKELKIRYTQLEAPEADMTNQPHGTIIKEDGVYKFTYDGSTENPGVKISRRPDAESVNRLLYTTDPTSPSLPNTIDLTKVTGDLFIPLPTEDLVTGQKIKLRVAWGNGSQTTGGEQANIVCTYTGGGSGGDQTVTLPAPVANVAEGSYAAVNPRGLVYFTRTFNFELEPSREVENPTYQYQFIAPDASGAWPQTPEGTWEAVTGNKIEVTKTGRLFVRETPGAGEEANYSYRDVELVSSKVTDLGLSGITDGQVITLKENEGYVITGKYETVVPNNTTGEPSGTKFVYITDKQGRAIKMIIEGNTNEPTFNSYEAGLGLNNITGVVRGIETGLPELWITTSALDYAAFLPGVTINPSFAAENKTVTEINRADFNKKVVLRGVTFKKADNLFTTATGATVKPYARLITTPAFSEITNLIEGTTYSVEGFVGNANGDMVLLPTGAIATPRLLAPNPITASAEDEANGYITVNVVSDLVEITPDTEGVREGTSLVYTINGGEEQTLPEIKTTPAKIAIAAADYDSEGKCVLTVKYHRENITGETVEIHLIKHDAVSVASIAEFKQKYPDGTETGDDVYYRYTGNALVRVITPQYLYLRDMPEGDAEFTKDELSDHSILLYNENGWEAPVAMNVRDDEAPRALKPGDIITSFAFKADRTHLQNLRGDATGFARTLRREPATKMEYEPQTKDILTENTAFTKDDRMVRFVIKNVNVKQTVIDPDEYDDDLKRHRYTLEMAGSPELNIGDIFVLRKGWSTAYDAGSLYDIDGVVIRNGADDKYAVAMIDFTFSDKTEALSAPVLAIEGTDPDAENPNSFLTTARIVMTSAEGADIYYTTDRSDPRRSATRVKYSSPLEISATTTVKAFASKPGEIPSDMVETEFTRDANDRRFIVNFLDQAEAGVPYHFSGTARVAAKGGEYIFVRGTQGHYLPIHVDDPALLAKIDKDSYVSDFVMEAHIIDTDEGAIVRGAHITADYAPLFSTPSADKPSTLDSDIQYEPDVVTTITADNARRYVKIMGVRLIGTEFEAEDDAASHDTEWKLTTDKGDGVDIPVNHNILTPTFNWDEADQTAAAYYNVTGFAMLGDDGGIELWPLEVEKVKSSEPVVPSFTGNITVAPVTADGLTTVEFYPYTTVSLRCPIADPESATIYYYVSDNGSLPAEGAKWNVYAQPFVITSDAYITMYATAPGYEQSAPTHIDAKLGKPAGTVAFDVTPDPGKTTVKMTAAEGAEIYYTTDLEKDEWTLYTEALSYTEPAMLWAYAKEGVKKGAVSSMYVMVMPEETEEPVDPSEPTDPTEPEDPADRISGRVKFELTDDGQGTVLVKISPADANLEPGKYEIWYTTKTGVNLPEGGIRYTDPGFEMTESGLVMAVLVEKATGKAVGQTCEVTVWVVPAPTAIDSISGDSSESVRVEGSEIIAPEGSEVYDIAGRRVSAEGLHSGVYIVRTPDGKAIKVKVD